MRTFLLSLCLTFLGCARAPVASAPSTPPSPSLNPEAIVNAADRTPEDRALDAGRNPATFLTFTGVQPGMKVADLMAGGGYTAELLARAVGPTGTVYGHNTPGILQLFAEKPWSERLARPVNHRVQRVNQEFDAPLPAQVNDLDVVVSNAIYHDTVWLGADRAKMNAAVFNALKPGGAYVVIDSSAVMGSGVNDVKTLHRIDEQVVREEVLAAGFQLVDESPAWRNPEDARDWNVSPGAAGTRRGSGDRFALKFVRPLR